MSVVVAAFYKFVTIDDCATLRVRLLDELGRLAMKGTILLAPEGINGTISAAPPAMAAFLGLLRADPRFADLVTKDAAAPDHPFQRLKVKIKREIITFGRPDGDPCAAQAQGRAGTYVAPSDWDALIADPDVLVLDTRNAYEVAAGTFPGAVDPGLQRFSDLPAFVEARLDPARHRKIAMFCTGGIRCEKAAAHMRAQGFARVYHLQGGILGYLAQVPPERSSWVGTCFVFDERETVDAAAVAPPVGASGPVAG
jgi:UPF0176 protein